MLAAGAPDVRIPVLVEVREAMGSEVYAHFKVDAPPVLTEDTRDLAADKGLDDLELAGQPENATATFVARLNPRTTAVRGKPMELEVDVRRLPNETREEILFRLRKIVRDGIRAVQAGRDPREIVCASKAPIGTYCQDRVLRIAAKKDPEADAQLLRETGRAVALGS